jgi:nickel superoxide dismutase
MKNVKLIFGCFALLFGHGEIHAHCQMPCGIYHDDMVFDQIDQYVETMYKGISVLNNNKFSNPRERNEFVRWVLEKDQASDESASLLTKYFLQQKIKSGEPDTVKRLVSLHKLLCNLVIIKQNVDLKFVETFSDEWEQFKLMFHREGYECDMEKIRMKKEALKKAAAAAVHDHDHEHGNEHEHSHEHGHEHDDARDHDHPPTKEISKS